MSHRHRAPAPGLELAANRPERVRARLAEIEAEERFRRGVYLRTLALLAGLTLLGLVCITLGLVSTSATWGPLVFWLGVIAADLGFVVTLGWAYLRLEH